MIRCFCFFILFQCQIASAASNNQYIPARYVVLAQEIREEMAVKYAKKYQMAQISTLGGLIHKVNILGYDFQIRGPLSQERLREILVDCVEGLLDALNSNEEIRPFLKTYPYTADGIEIAIVVMDSNGKKNLFYPHAGVATALKGKIIYRYYDPSSEWFKDKDRKEEPYEDAVRIVKGGLNAPSSAKSEAESF